MTNSPKRPPVFVALVVIAAFVFGMYCARRQVFPFPVLQSAWRAVMGDPTAPQRPDHPSGLWRTARDNEAEQPDGLAELANLPYLRGKTSQPDASGITSYDPEAAQDGYNLVISAHAPEASLVDMSGNVVHTWARSFADVWPEALGYRVREAHKTFWRTAHAFPTGDLLVIFDGIGMVKLDANSEVVWAQQGRYHSDLKVDDQGQIFTLARRPRDEHEGLAGEGPFLEDFVVKLSADGEELTRVSVLDALLESDYAPLFFVADARADILRTNSIELLDSSHPKFPMWQRNRVLLSLSALHTIAVLDLDQEKVTWAMTGMFAHQNRPTLLSDGTLLLFDNRGLDGGTRVIEVNPLTEQIVWSCPAGDGPSFFDSAKYGAAQRLANGNTLITESEGGRAIEVTPGQEIAWEYVNPRRSDDDELIAVLCEVKRLDRGPFDEGFLGAAPGTRTEIDTSELRELIEKKK